MNRIRSQQYAKQAYGLVEAVQNTEFSEKYRTLALSFPNMVLQSGLCQAVGFLLAKNEEHHQELLAHLALLTGKDKEKFHNEILDANLSHYQLMTRQTLEAAGWLKRYTQALLKPKDD